MEDQNEYERELNAIKDLLKIQYFGDNENDLLLKISNTVSKKLNSSLDTSGSLLDDGNNLRKATNLLRMLYISQLKETQIKTNELISQLQNHTAKPTIDSNLAVLGK